MRVGKCKSGQVKRVGAIVNDVEQMGSTLGNSELYRINQNYQRKIKTGMGRYIDVEQVESGWAKWMRGGASLKQDEANRNG